MRRSTLAGLCLALTQLACSSKPAVPTTAPAAAPAPPAQQVVPGGTAASSPRYRMVSTVGEPVAAASASSTHYRLQGGLVGAQGSLP